MRNSSSLPLNQLIGEILMLMTRDFQQRLDHDLEQRGVHGISARHRSVFLHLGYYGPSRAADLAEAAGVRPQSMMTAIHELEAMGLITRHPDPDDSRAKRIHYSPAGEQLIDELSRSTEAVWQDYAELLGETELTELFRGLQGLLARSKSAQKDADRTESAAVHSLPHQGGASQ